MQAAGHSGAVPCRGVLRPAPRSFRPPFTEWFYPNFNAAEDPQSAGPTAVGQAIRKGKYKFIRVGGGGFSSPMVGLYDLDDDIDEGTNLIGQVGQDEELGLAYTELLTELDNISADPFTICPEGHQIGDSCATGETCCSRACFSGHCANPTGLEECSLGN